MIIIIIIREWPAMEIMDKYENKTSDKFVWKQRKKWPKKSVKWVLSRICRWGNGSRLGTSISLWLWGRIARFGRNRGCELHQTSNNSGYQISNHFPCFGWAFFLTQGVCYECTIDQSTSSALQHSTWINRMAWLIVNFFALIACCIISGVFLFDIGFKRSFTWYCATVNTSARTC